MKSESHKTINDDHKKVIFSFHSCFICLYKTQLPYVWDDMGRLYDLTSDGLSIYWS